MTHPLTHTVAQINKRVAWASITTGQPSTGEWALCSQSGPEFIAEWEARVTHMLRRDFHRHHPMASAAYVLDWYASISGCIGGMSFGLARRVPRLDRQSLAFHRHNEHAYPDGIALLSPRFWCLPSDPDATHRDADVVSTERDLARILRTEIRLHADDFLSNYRGGAQLPRRHLLGVFFDSLDTGMAMQTGAAPAQILADAKSVLPGGSREFEHASTISVVHDSKQREHVTRKRISCCYYFKVADGGVACATCPRTTDEERLARLERFADQQH
ncbi:(2Fe-2S)-binding protein [Hoyosella subflava]|uniref:(2Fe-2S)-binding protein n=1 Tax=Hoyosella subflava TaxID=639313 RepID=UPI0009FEF79F|nr:(2Fe-2S)-binding protein [Hoyosella subflava]